MKKKDQPSRNTDASKAHGKPDVSDQFTFRRYERNGKHYHEARGELGVPGKVREHRSSYSQSQLSAGKGDDAGHLVGNQFGAPGGGENLGLQNWKTNRHGTYKQLENHWARRLKGGSRISVRVRDAYRSGSDRPFARHVSWTETRADGSQKTYRLSFANTHTPESRFKQDVKPAVQRPQKDNVVPLRPENAAYVPQQRDRTSRRDHPANKTPRKSSGKRRARPASRRRTSSPAPARKPTARRSAPPRPTKKSSSARLNRRQQPTRRRNSQTSRRTRRGKQATRGRLMRRKGAANDLRVQSGRGQKVRNQTGRKLAARRPRSTPRPLKRPQRSNRPRRPIRPPAPQKVPNRTRRTTPTRSTNKKAPARRAPVRRPAPVPRGKK